MPYISSVAKGKPLHGVVETHAYLRDADDAGMDEEERAAFATFIAQNPTAGDVVSGTGSCRKVRWKKPGNGKSRGYRVVTFYGGERVPIFLLTVFGKNDKANLTQGERNALAKLTATLVGSLKGTKK